MKNYKKTGRTITGLISTTATIGNLAELDTGAFKNITDGGICAGVFLSGGTAAQACTIQVKDIVIGIKAASGVALANLAACYPTGVIVAYRGVNYVEVDAGSSTNKPCGYVVDGAITTAGYGSMAVTPWQETVTVHA